MCSGCKKLSANLALLGAFHTAVSTIALLEIIWESSVAPYPCANTILVVHFPLYYPHLQLKWLPLDVARRSVNRAYLSCRHISACSKDKNILSRSYLVRIRIQTINSRILRGLLNMPDDFASKVIYFDRYIRRSS